MAGMYDEELAFVYDSIYAARRKDYRGEAAQLAELVRARRPGARTLLDVGCGTGEHLRHLIDRGFDVQGVDLSESMLEIGRAKLPGVPLHRADMRSFDLGRRFDVVTCLFGAVGEVGSHEALRSAIRCLAAHLAPGGVLVLEPWYLRESWQDGQVSYTHTEQDGRLVVRVCRRWSRGDVAHLDLHYLIADANGVRHRTAEHRETLFSRHDHEDACRQAGVDVEFVEGGPSGRGLFLGVRTAKPPAEPLGVRSEDEHQNRGDE